MIKQKLILVFMFFSLGPFCEAQESVNWLELSDFESAIEKGEKPTFIFIKELRKDMMDGRANDDRSMEMQARMFDFLNDEKLVSVLNESFNCLKFDPAIDSVVFNDTTYKKVKDRGRENHEFVNVLTGSDRNRLPAIVLRNKDFKLYEFKMRPSQLEEMKILLVAEELKANYLKENLSEDNPTLRESGMMLKRAQKQVDSEEANLEKLDKSIFGGRQQAATLVKKLNYFLDEAFKEMDLQTYEGL